MIREQENVSIPSFPFKTFQFQKPFQGVIFLVPKSYFLACSFPFQKAFPKFYLFLVIINTSTNIQKQKQKPYKNVLINSSRERK